MSDKTKRVLVSIAGFIVGLGMTLLMFGCAAGRNATGGTVVGFEVGAPIPEGVGEAATLFGGLVGGPTGAAIATGLVGLVTAWGVKKSGDAKAATARHEGETKGWEDAAGKPAQSAPIAPAVVPTPPIVKEAK